MTTSIYHHCSNEYLWHLCLQTMQRLHQILLWSAHHCRCKQFAVQLGINQWAVGWKFGFVCSPYPLRGKMLDSRIFAWGHELLMELSNSTKFVWFSSISLSVLMGKSHEPTWITMASHFSRKSFDTSSSFSWASSMLRPHVVAAQCWGTTGRPLQGQVSAVRRTNYNSVQQGPTLTCVIRAMGI